MVFFSDSEHCVIRRRDPDSSSDLHPSILPHHPPHHPNPRLRPKITDVSQKEEEERRHHQE